MAGTKPLSALSRFTGGPRGIRAVLVALVIGAGAVWAWIAAHPAGAAGSGSAGDRAASTVAGTHPAVLVVWLAVGAAALVSGLILAGRAPRQLPASLLGATAPDLFPAVDLDAVAAR